MSRKPHAKATFTVALAVMAGTLGGCGMDDIAFEGGIFDAVGLNNTATKKAEPKLADRGPLVVPPTLERLPQPGEQLEAQAADVTPLLDDPDRKIVVSEAELQKKQEEYCRKHYDLAKALGDNNADLAKGPLGDCRPSVLNVMKQMNGGESPIIIGGGAQ